MHYEFQNQAKNIVTKLTYFLKFKSKKRTKNNIKNPKPNKIVLYTREGINISNQ